MPQDKEYYKQYAAKNKERIRAKNKAWAERNREKRVATTMKWRAKNRSRFDEYQKKYQKENAAKISAQNIAYKNAHKDARLEWELRRKERLKTDPVALEARRASHRAYYERNRDVRIERVKKYAAAHPDKVRQWSRITNTRRRAIAGKHTLRQWQQKFLFYGQRCVYCERPVTIEKTHKDHVIPLNDGGMDWVANLAPACNKCNLRKHTKRWLPHQPRPHSPLPS